MPYSTKEIRDLWDLYLKTWPIDRLRKLTLDDYLPYDDSSSLRYWLETKTRPIGKIGKQGYGPMFGIYLLKDKKLPYSDRIKWTKGDIPTKEEAFDTIKKHIVETAEYAQRGYLDEIDSIDWTSGVKWKIAFLYQDRNNPILVNNFQKTTLAPIVGLTEDESTPTLHKKAFKKDSFKNLMKELIK